MKKRWGKRTESGKWRAVDGGKREDLKDSPISSSSSSCDEVDEIVSASDGSSFPAPGGDPSNSWSIPKSDTKKHR